MQPMVVRVRKRRRRRYTRELRAMQRTHLGVSRASSRVVQAVAAGLDAYARASSRSSRRRRDGMIRDFPRNLLKGVRAAFKRARSRRLHLR